MTRRLVLVGALATAVLALVACGSSSKSSQSQAGTTTATPKQSKPSTSKPAASEGSPSQPAVSSVKAGKTCVPVSDGLRQKILKNVVLEGATLRHVEAVESPLVAGFYFVSGTVDGSGAHHQLATWATQRLDGHSPVYSVDSFAALISTYAAATQENPDLSTLSPGSYRSRVCAFGTTATRGIDAPQSGVGNAPAGN
jgi:hypothetical protein